MSPAFNTFVVGDTIEWEAGYKFFITATGEQTVASPESTKKFTYSVVEIDSALTLGFSVGAALTAIFLYF